jgi:uncharacterized protein YjbI with pentapeptide repeats
MKFTAQVRKEVEMRIKNKLDISDLIKDYDVNGEDLSGAIITSFDRPGKDISGINLHNAIIGSKNVTTNWNRVVARGCQFQGCQFLGQLNARKADFRNTIWDGAFAPYVDYRFANMRGGSFCECVFTISTLKSYGAKFDTLFFKDLAKHWNIKIEVLEDKLDDE